MELWILGTGAIVLIAISVWIVWPAPTQPVDPEALPVRDEEDLKGMTESARPPLTPQGDRFEDQYTSATADLSPGGVAAAFQSLQDDDGSPSLPSSSSSPSSPPPSNVTPAPVTPYPAGPPGAPTEPAAAPASSDRWPEAPASDEHIGQPSRIENFPYSPQEDHASSSGFAQPRTIGMAAAAVVALASAAGGAWLYARWQRERNKPINRLRRGARDAASRLGERVPQLVDDLPISVPAGRAPLGGAATALLLASLLAARARRGETPKPADDTSDLLELGKQQVRRLPRLRQLADASLDSVPSVEQPRPAVLGIGFGGLAIVAGGAYLVYRLVRGSDAPDRQTNWYAGGE